MSKVTYELHNPETSRTYGSFSAEEIARQRDEAAEVVLLYRRVGAKEWLALSSFSPEPETSGLADILDLFQDLFADYFSGGAGTEYSQSEFGRAGAAEVGRHVGEDIVVAATITLRDAMLGVKREYVTQGWIACTGCASTGCRPGTRSKDCRSCKGTGQVVTQRGFLVVSNACTRCGGNGRLIPSPCKECGGSGRVAGTRTILATFPAGVETGHRLRVRGLGMAGVRGAPQGDFYVDVDVESNSLFERQGYDLVTRCSLTPSELISGTQRDLTLPHSVHSRKLMVA
jgi:molecular chaperone DnaJ